MNNFEIPDGQEGRPFAGDILTSIVHIAADEANALDDLQGGPSIDPQYDLREYRKLYKLPEIPEIRDLFKTVMADIEDDGKLSPQLEQTYKQAEQMQGLPHPYQKAPGELEEPIRDIEKDAPAPDKEMVLMPDSLTEFFISLDPRWVTTNPETGLLQFGWNPIRAIGNIFKSNPVRSAIRVAATIGGAMIPGLGPVIGAGVGNMAGRALTGQKPGMDMIMGGLKNAGYMGLGQMALGATGLGGTIQGMMPGALAGHTAGLFTPSAATAATSGLSAGEQGFLQSARHSAGLAPAAGGLMSGMGNMMNAQSLIPMAAMALAWKGQQKEHDFAKQQHEDRERHRKEWIEKTGIYKPFDRPKGLNRVRNPRFISLGETPDEPMWINDEENATMGYKAHGGMISANENRDENYRLRGGLIQGPGDGTADKIKTQVPAGSFILSADVVSKFGNGSSREGARRLDEFFQKFPSYADGGELMARGGQKGKGGMVPVYLSNDEYCVPADKVTALGRGSNKKGSEMLHNLMKNIRLQKNKAGGKLPPDAKSPSDYLKGK